MQCGLLTCSDDAVPAPRLYRIGGRAGGGQRVEQEKEVGRGAQKYGKDNHYKESSVTIQPNPMLMPLLARGWRMR